MERAIAVCNVCLSLRLQISMSARVGQIPACAMPLPLQLAVSLFVRMPHLLSHVAVQRASFWIRIKSPALVSTCTVLLGECEGCNHAVCSGFIRKMLLLTADTDECSDAVLNTCDDLCINTVGSFTCDCASDITGLYLSPIDGETCIGEIFVGKHPVQHYSTGSNPV